MSFYVLFNILIVFFPFVLSFDKKVGFYKKWKYVFPAISITAIIYIIWDVLVTKRGDWWFSAHYTGNFHILGLPLGEILFFFTVPYACLFIYEVISAYTKEKLFKIPVYITPGLGIIFFIVSLFFFNKDYTFLAFFSVSIFLFFSTLFYKELFASNHRIFYFVICLIPFLGANVALTALPVVNYNPLAIIGFRVITIPIEDFFYNISLLGFNLLLYLIFKRKFSP